MPSLDVLQQVSLVIGLIETFRTTECFSSSMHNDMISKASLVFALELTLRTRPHLDFRYVFMYNHVALKAAMFSLEATLSTCQHLDFCFVLMENHMT